MTQKKHISVSHYCKQTHIADTFVTQLHEYGLITVEEAQDDFFIDENDISEIERMFRLHNDLGINFEGLDAIQQMLERMQKLEKKLDLLQNRLRLYE